MTEPEKTPEIGSFVKTKAETTEGVAAVESFLGGADVGSVRKMPEPKDKPEEGPQQTVEEVTDEISQLEEDIEKVEAAPELTYEEKLKRHGVTKEEAEKIIDALMVDGIYQKTYAITKKYDVTFRTRLMEDQNRALDAIEFKGPQYPTTVGNIVAGQNLAASIVKFRDIDFAEVKIKERIEWVQKLPDTVARLLANKLAKFDQLILDVLDEGAIENF